MLSVEKLNAFYGQVQILHDIDLAVGVGQIVALVGANAAGKSTLMFSLAGLRTDLHRPDLDRGSSRSTPCPPTSASCAAWCWCRSGVGCFRS